MADLSVGGKSGEGASSLPRAPPNFLYFHMCSSAFRFAHLGPRITPINRSTMNSWIPALIDFAIYGFIGVGFLISGTKNLKVKTESKEAREKVRNWALTMIGFGLMFLFYLGYLILRRFV